MNCSNLYCPYKLEQFGLSRNECEYRSAPYFDVRIDGITLLNESW